MPSSSVLRRVLVVVALASPTALQAPGAGAQLLPTDPTTTTTPAPTPTTAPVTTTTAAPATTSTAATTTLAPTTTRPVERTATTTTAVPAASTTVAPATGTSVVDPAPTDEGPPPSLPPLSTGGGTRVNWAALISLAGFGIGFAMLALPAILQRRLNQPQSNRPARPRTRS